MEQPPPLPPQKSTPARRRPKRPVNSPARKTYASENDMPSEALFAMELAGPFTPQKPAANSPAPSTQPNQAKSKPRNGNGNGNRRAKQVSSPGPAKQGRTTPPHTAAPKPISAAAFAGATFHASPAPSSLPIPSFLSKALDSPSVQETDHASREPSPPATDSEAAPTPQHRLLSTDITRQESPLDIFFRADRAEKERARRASSANILGPNPIPFSPPMQVRSPVEPKTVPHDLFGAGNRRPGFQRNPSGGIPTSELDGTPGTFIGPALSKPYQERIRAARSTKKQSESAQNPTLSPQDSAVVDMSEKLKRFLAIPSLQEEEQQQQQQRPPHISTRSSGSTSVHLPPFSAGFHPQRSADLQPAFSTRPQPQGPGELPQFFSQSPQLPRSADMLPPFGSTAHPGFAQPASPAAPQANGTSRSAEILHMEDSLRRMLKLNIGPAPAAPPPTNYQSS